MIAAEAAPADPEGLLVLAVALVGLPVLAWLVRAEVAGASPFPRGAATFGPERTPVLLVGTFALLFAYNVAGMLLVFASGTGPRVLALLVIAAPVALWASGRFPHALVPRARPARLVGLGLLAAWAALPLVLGTHLLLQGLTTDEPQGFVEQIARRDSGWGWIVLLAVVVAPVMEELSLRGLLYPALRRWWGPRAALIATSVLFGFMHWEPPTVWAPLAMLGAVFAWTVERTGSVLPAIAGHVAFNSISVLALL